MKTAPVDEDNVRMSPAAALRQMVDSEGWSLFLAHVRKEWGQAAQNRKIRAAVEGTDAANHSATVQAILGTGEEIVKLFAWPEAEVGAMEQAEKTKPQPADAFAHHRRLP